MDVPTRTHRMPASKAFHPVTGWVNPDVIGIDVGITLLSAENLRSGRVWKCFKENPEITSALDRAAAANR